MNWNQRCRFALSEKGWKIYDDYLSHHQISPREDRTSPLVFSLWEAANIFGEHLYNGCVIPFETMNFELVPPIIGAAPTTSPIQPNQDNSHRAKETIQYVLEILDTLMNHVCFTKPSPRCDEERGICYVMHLLKGLRDTAP